MNQQQTPVNKLCRYNLGFFEDHYCLDEAIGFMLVRDPARRKIPFCAEHFTKYKKQLEEMNLVNAHPQ